MKRILVLLCGLVIGASAAVNSQEKSDPPEDPSITVNEIVEYFRQDIFIEPGVGLKKVFLDMPMRDVLATWGRPIRQKVRGLVNKRVSWLYRAGDGTLIAVTGLEEKVSRMAFKAGRNSEYQTRKGARFGMPPHRIVTIYGRPKTKQKKNHIFYPDLGIGFVFSRLKVSEIFILKPLEPVLE